MMIGSVESGMSMSSSQGTTCSQTVVRCVSRESRLHGAELGHLIGFSLCVSSESGSPGQTPELAIKL